MSQTTLSGAFQAPMSDASQRIKELEEHVREWKRMLALARKKTEKNVPIKDDSLGKLVWGRLSKSRWYPGVVIDGQWASKPPAGPGKVWIIWFGDYKITKLPLNSVEWFGYKYPERVKGKLPAILEFGVRESLTECCIRQGKPISIIESVLETPETFHDIFSGPSDGDPLAPTPGHFLPQKLEEVLIKVSGGPITYPDIDLPQNRTDLQPTVIC